MCKSWKRKQTHIFHLSGFFRLQTTNSIKCFTIFGCNQREHTLESQTPQTCPPFIHTWNEVLMRRREREHVNNFHVQNIDRAARTRFPPETKKKLWAKTITVTHSSIHLQFILQHPKVFQWIHVLRFGMVIPTFGYFRAKQISDHVLNMNSIQKQILNECLKCIYIEHIVQFPKFGIRIKITKFRIKPSNEMHDKTPWSIRKRSQLGLTAVFR